MADTILRFRPHHLLCMLTYKGNGYSKSFVENFDLLIERMNTSSVTLEICKGPDDICAPRLCDPTDATCHCHDADLLKTDDQALADLGTLPSLDNISYGSTIPLTRELIRDLRTAYAKNTIRTACQGCEWKEFCDQIKDDQFQETKLI